MPPDVLHIFVAAAAADTVVVLLVGLDKSAAVVASVPAAVVQSRI